MNPQITRISETLHESIFGEPWYGTSLFDLLEGVSADDAAAHPLPGRHSIWELVLHITAWRKFVIEKLRGNEAFDLRYDTPEEWPAVGDTSAESWDEALGSLSDSQLQLEAELAGFQEARLTEPVGGREYDLGYLLYGILQHDVYHAGQVALLKRVVG
ncbi:MAG: DinB family protein [Bacteroidetes bacterium]|nr:MAG: DinB family protein [Bacteroidota bacterium]